MFKKILFCSLFILIFLIPSKQDPNAKTWERHNTAVHADSIIAAIDRGDSVIIDSCEIFDPLIKEGTEQKADTIKGELHILGSIFSDTVSFSDCHFIGLVNFGHSTFKTGVSFSRVIFHMDVFFSSATFKEGISFWWCTFGKDAWFSGTMFEKWVNFRGTSFSGRANFVFADFTKWASFKDVVFGGTVSLSPIEFRRIDGLSWRQLEGHLNYSREANFKLMKHLEERRILEDADGIYLFLKDQERMEKSKLQRYLEYWFIQLTCGYGVKPLRTLIVCALVIVLFSAFYAKSNAIKEIEKELGHRRRRRKFGMVHKGFWMRFYDALCFSVHTFIIGVVSDWYPTNEFLIKTKKIRLFKFRTLSMIEGALGWILLVLFVVTLTRKFIR